MIKTQFIDIDKIKIQKKFKKSRPRPEKLIRKTMYFKDYGKFDTTIEVDENNVLIDGYCAYLIAKEQGIELVEVTRDVEPSEADKMFEKLGYRYARLNDLIRYEKRKTALIKVIVFDMANEKIKIQYYVGSGMDVDIEELKAINEKVKELGWNE